MSMLLNFCFLCVSDKQLQPSLMFVAKASEQRHYDNTYKHFAYNDLTYNFNKYDITYNGINLK